METRKLGQSELEISPVGIGTAPIGSTPAWKIYWGPQDEGDAIRAIEAALELGINWIDTAPFYGWGRGEQIVGKALRGKRDKVFVFTKCGTIADEQGNWGMCLKPDSIRREVEASLRNLQTDYIDLYQFHDIDPEVPIEESWEAVQTLIAEGKVRYAGLSNHTVDLIERAQNIAPVISNQHQYSLLNREIEQDVLPFSRQHNMGVLAWSPLASGFLTDGFDVTKLDENDFRRNSRYTREPYSSKLQQLRKTLQAIAQDNHKTLADLAIAWVLRQSTLTGAIIGIRNEQEALAMTNGANWKLTEQELEIIEEALALWEGKS